MVLIDYCCFVVIKICWCYFFYFMKSSWFTNLILLVVGLIFTAIGAVVGYRDITLARTGVHVEGVVVELIPVGGAKGGVTYYPLLEYALPDGTSVKTQGPYGANPPGFVVGDRVALVYEAQQPSHIVINSFFGLYLIPLIFGGGGVLLLLSPVLVFLYRKRREWICRELVERGVRVQATLTEVAYVDNYRVNGRSPFMIVCQAPDASSGAVREFESDYLWFDPTEYVKDRKKIDVYIDAKNSQRYYVDLRFLPKTA